MEYLITADQLEVIEHHRRMFELEAERIEGLCSSEKDDVVYGFELGKMHSHLRDCFTNMYGLVEEIRNQVVKEQNPCTPLNEK